MGRPLLSVILTSHEKPELLSKAVASVLCQTMDDLELVICDDSSTNPDVSVIMNEAQRDRRVKVLWFRHGSKFREDHKMVAVMVNNGLDVARGKYVSYLCDDDHYMPDRCGRMVEELDACGCQAVVGFVRWIHADGRRSEQDSVSYNYKPPLEVGHTELLRMIRPSNFICHDSIVHVETNERWPIVDSHTPVDWRFWCSMVCTGWVFKKIDYVGEEAFFPGLWRDGMDMEQAMAALNTGEANMTVIEYAKNISKKVQVIPTDNGSPIEVERDGLVELKHVCDANGRMNPAFTRVKSLRVPTISTDQVDGTTKAENYKEPPIELPGSLREYEPPPVVIGSLLNSKANARRKYDDGTDVKKCMACGADLSLRNASGYCRKCFVVATKTLPSKPKAYCKTCSKELCKNNESGFCRNCYNSNKKSEVMDGNKDNVDCCANPTRR